MSPRCVNPSTLSRWLSTAPARLAGLDHRKGRLVPGMLADIVVLSADLRSLPPAELLDVQVDYTIVDGHVRHERQ